MTDGEYVGVDWSSGAWVAVTYSGGEAPQVNVFEEIEDLWECHGGSADRIVVDVPIGLCESVDAGECRCEKDENGLSRLCDDLARRIVGSRSSSVFTTPCRKAAQMAADAESPYADVNEMNKTLTMKGLMRQAANISDGIVEVERLILEGDGDEEILVEGHPEVCFRAFNGNPLQFSKKTAAGVEERLSALETVEEYEDSHWRYIAERLRAVDHNVGVDDVLDAIALALTAAAPEGEYRVLPENPPRDSKGLPMQMVYRSEEPFMQV